jgi:hypothetical protein
MFAAYGYSFWVGSYFIESKIYNDFRKQDYTSGDVVSIFFGILVACWGITGVTPFWQAII